MVDWCSCFLLLFLPVLLSIRPLTTQSVMHISGLIEFYRHFLWLNDVRYLMSHWTMGIEYSYNAMRYTLTYTLTRYSNSSYVRDRKKGEYISRANTLSPGILIHRIDCQTYFFFKKNQQQ